jgi:hypothetical protein
VAGTDRSSARRASRSILELARLLSDGEWHGIDYLAVAAGKYLRPEVAWRCSGGSTTWEGQQRYIDKKLRQWERLGRVEKRRNGNSIEWRLVTNQWVHDYLEELARRRAAGRQISARLEAKRITDTTPVHKPGRPRAVPDNLARLAVDLYQRGHGYRAIARMLRTEGISPSFGTIRNIIKGQKVV